MGVGTLQSTPPKPASTSNPAAVAAMVGGVAGFAGLPVGVGVSSIFVKGVFSDAPMSARKERAMIGITLGTAAAIGLGAAQLAYRHEAGAPSRKANILMTTGSIGTTAGLALGMAGVYGLKDAPAGLLGGSVGLIGGMALGLGVGYGINAVVEKLDR